MRKLFLVSLLTLLLVVGSLFAAEQFPRSETLYIAGHQSGPPTSFNPFAGSPAWPMHQGMNLIYETLFLFNLINGELEPGLAQSYEWVDDLTLKVTLYDGAYWQDEQPVTAEDVVYSFELAKKYPLGHSVVWEYLEKAWAEDSKTIYFKMKADNPNRLILLNQLWTVFILPKHIWTKVEEDAGYDVVNFRRFENKEPIGSGPYKLHSFNSERVVLERYDKYWKNKIYGGLPKPKYIIHPIFKSNDEGNLAFEKGEVDLSQQFAPQIWKMWEDKKLPVSTWFKEPPYHIPASTPSIWFNLHKHPLDVPEVRKAIAYSIDYAKIAELAMTKYSPTARSSLILPFGVEKEFFNEDIVKQYGWEYNPKKAIELLESIGCKKGPDGIYRLPDGTRLGPFKIECPYGWTDWMVSLQIVAQGARRVGIDIQTYFPDTPVWADDRNTGNFDIIMNTPAGYPGPTQPWARFQDALYSKGNAPIGQVAFRNWGRYENPRADELIEMIPKVTDKEELKKLYAELDKIYMQDVPLIVLEYRPWLFYEFNETHWKGFPTAENPYAPPTVLTAAAIKVLWHIEPVK